MTESRFTPQYTTEQRVPRIFGKNYKSFIIISLVHTVTDFIVELLRANPEVLMHGELFNEIEAEAFRPSYLSPWTMDTRDESPSSFMQHLLTSHDKCVGLLSRPDQWTNRQYVLNEIAHNSKNKKIVITGDPLRSFAVYCQQVKRGKLFSQEVTITPDGIQRFIDEVKKAEEFYKEIFPPSEALWISHKEFFDDTPRASMKLFSYLGIPPIELPLQKMLTHTSLEQEFCPERFLKQHVSKSVYELLRYCFNLEDVGTVEKSTPSSSSTKTDSSESSDSIRTTLRWALLVPIKSTDGNYSSERLKTFFRSLTKSLAAESLERLFVQFGIDEDDILKTELSTLVDDIMRGIAYRKSFLNEERGHVCKIWNKLASEAIKGNCDFFVFLGDDITFEGYNWMGSIERKFHEISCRTKLNYGVGCVAFNDLGFPNFPTFPVLHRSHLELFGEVFNSRFINQGGDPYLFELYNHLGAAVIDKSAKIRNNIGGNSTSPSRYEKRSIRFKNSILSRSLDVLRNKYGKNSVLPTLDVVVPSYRLRLDVLDRILNLRVSRRCQVKFWVVVDNPDHPCLAEVQEKYDGNNENGNYGIQVLVHPKNLGAGAARNTGMMRSCANWIVLFDDDVHPKEDILDQYLAATFRYPDADAFAGVTLLPKAVSWWQKSLELSGITSFYQIASRMTRVPWSVTANLCVRGRTNEGVLFRLDYPNSGGGEDIDFCFRLKKDPRSIVAVPNAIAHHQWFGDTAIEAFKHVMKWVIGDSLCIELLPQHTYSVFPGWTEFLLFASLPAITCGIFLKVFVLVTCLEIALKSLALCTDPTTEVLESKETIMAAFFGSIILMGQEAIRTACHIRRKTPRALFRRVDWFDGMNQKATALSERQHAFKFALYSALFCYLAGKQNFLQH